MGSAIHQGAGGCQCGSTCAGCPSCPGASICRNLTVSWSNIQVGGGSTIMVNVAGGCTWNGGCATSTMKVGFDMTGASPVLNLTFYPGTCPGGTPSAVCSVPMSSLTCSPFNCVFTITSANCPTAYAQGYRSFTITL